MSPHIYTPVKQELKIIISWGIFFLRINLLQLKFGCLKNVQCKVKRIHQFFYNPITNIYQLLLKWGLYFNLLTLASLNS